MSAPARGMLDLEELERGISDGRIETVVTALPDLYGRLVGKRILGRFFLEEIASHGMHVCDYLLACDMEMDPTPGYAFTSWETGYGDLRALPDFSTLRTAAWLDRTAIVLCDAVTDEGDGLFALSGFLHYTHFDPRPFPNLVARLEAQGIQRPAPTTIPFACRRD